jgi:hypothetical protein
MYIVPQSCVYVNSKRQWCDWYCCKVVKIVPNVVKKYYKAKVRNDAVLRYENGGIVVLFYF